MVSEAVAADASDALSVQADSLVRLDPCGNLKTTQYFQTQLENILGRRRQAACQTYRQVERLIKALRPGCPSKDGLCHRDMKVRVDVRSVPPEHWTFLDLGTNADHIPDQNRVTSLRHLN